MSDGGDEGRAAMLVDSHCHLDFPDFATEREAVLARARAAGVGTMLTIGTRLDEFDGVRAIAEADADIWCSVGAHPHEAADHADLLPAELAALARIPRSSASARPGSIFTTTSARATCRTGVSRPYRRLAADRPAADHPRPRGR